MELDDAYAIGAHIPGSDAFPPKWAAAAQAFRAAQGKNARIDLKYGDGARHRFDLFQPEGTFRGLFVFVHGGYWKAFDKSSWSHLAAGAVARGWAVAMPSYTLAPEARISAMTREIARAITAASGMIAGPIRLAGHSAGGHLVARMLAPGLLPDDVAARMGRVLPISPLSDLRPLLRTSMNDVLELDAAEAAAESPVLMTRRHAARVTVWVGSEERPALLDQARWLSQAWDAGLVIDPGRHHFDVIEPLENPHSPITQALLG